MKDINIKQEIMDLCDISIEFWKQFKKEISDIADNNKADLILKWKNYFVEHNEFALELSRTKMHAEMIEEDLIEQGVLELEE